MTTVVQPADKTYCGFAEAGDRVTAGARDTVGDEWDAVTCQQACLSSNYMCGSRVRAASIG